MGPPGLLSTPLPPLRLPIATVGVNYELNSDRYELVAKTGSNTQHKLWKVHYKRLSAAAATGASFSACCHSRSLAKRRGRRLARSSSDAHTVV